MARVIGVYENEQEVIEKIKNFEAEGIESKHFSVLARDDHKTKFLADELNVEEKQHENSGFFGAIGSFLGGGALPVTSSLGSAPFIAAGPMAATLLGGGTDGLRSVLQSVDLDEGVVDNYIAELDEGKIILFLED